MGVEKVCGVEEAWDGGCGRDWDERGVQVRGVGQSKTVWVCVSPPGHMRVCLTVLTDRPQWSACHGVTSPVAVCVCV